MKFSDKGIAFFTIDSQDDDSNFEFSDSDNFSESDY